MASGFPLKSFPSLSLCATKVNLLKAPETWGFLHLPCRLLVQTTQTNHIKTHTNVASMPARLFIIFVATFS